MGLDVHARSVWACTVDDESGEMRTSRISPKTAEIVKWAKALPGEVEVAYEAGPTGFGLARALIAAGVQCFVLAPSKTERPSGDRVKTDKRDCEWIARLVRLGELPVVVIPSEGQEAARDLVRAQVDVRGDLMRPGTGCPNCCSDRASSTTTQRGQRLRGGARCGTSGSRLPPQRALAWTSMIDAPSSFHPGGGQVRSRLNSRTILRHQICRSGGVADPAGRKSYSRGPTRASPHLAQNRRPGSIGIRHRGQRWCMAESGPSAGARVCGMTCGSVPEGSVAMGCRDDDLAGGAAHARW